MNYNSGYLELIIGPMYAGKTSKLLEYSAYFEKNNISTIALTHSDDVRYSIDKLSTHNKKMITCFKYKNISSLMYNKDINLEKFQNILIDEGQFFDDLNLIIDLVDVFKKHVYVFGLDGDYNRKKFGKILDLIPYCDKITKLHSICGKCKGPGLFSHRIINNDDQKLIGSDNEYISLCRNCYINA
mgnify:FL=1|jgi:thymidine kinase